ncbi:MAG TPA: hypothetical protein VFY03_13205 [Woeseiaceae bacterium]|nr:hypothetical protein [Woeseiaceae bacterium]
MNLPGRFTSLELWYLAAAPAAWLAHFVFLYGAAAVVCARPAFDYADLFMPGLLGTFAALVAVAAVARRGVRARRHDDAAANAGTPPRRPFLGDLLLGLAAVAGAGIVVTALVPAAIGGCW